MGSPWPWPQEPVKNSTSGSSLTTIQNNKRTNYGYPSYSSYYYNNQHNNHDLSQQHNLHHHQHSPHHQSSNHQHHRLPPPPPSEPDPMITNEIVMRKRALPPYFSFDCVPHPHHQHHSPTNNNYPSRKPPMAPSNSQQSQFATSVKEIPTWNIYYSDQKHRIIDFTGESYYFTLIFYDEDAFLGACKVLCHCAGRKSSCRSGMCHFFVCIRKLF